MLILVARYTLLMAFTFGGNDNLSSTLKAKIYTDAVCTANCLSRPHDHLKVQEVRHNLSDKINHKRNSLLSDCYAICNATHRNSPISEERLTKIHENFKSDLLCRDDRSLTFRIQDMGNRNITSTPRNTGFETKKATQKVYVIIVYENDVHYRIYMSDEQIFTIDKLEPKNSYVISVVAVHDSNQYSDIANCETYMTLQKNFMPGKVSEYRLTNFRLDDTKPKRLNGQLEWQPAEDKTCYYDVVCYAVHKDDFQPIAIRELSYKYKLTFIRQPKHLYSYKLKNLQFSTKYNIGVRSINSGNPIRETNLVWQIFETPSCLEFYNYNLSICAPETPEDLFVNKTLLNGDEYALMISWKELKHLPDFYTIRIVDLHYNSKGYFEYNVTKNSTSLFVPRISLLADMQEVILIASSPGGNSTASVQLYRDITEKEIHNDYRPFNASVLAYLFCIIVITIILFLMCNRRAKMKRHEERCKYFEELDHKRHIEVKSTLEIPTKAFQEHNASRVESCNDLKTVLERKIFFDDAMELERKDIVLYDVLGEGAFGLVRRGIYNDKTIGALEVAVKMLKDNPSSEDVNAFRQEIEVMKSVGRHKNIVGIIGHCTRLFNEMLLVTEYCSLGSLLDFLRDEWKYLQENVKNYHTDEADQPENTKIKSAFGQTSQVEILPKTNTVTATANKSYGYPETCTNACKCHVNIAIKNIDALSSQRECHQLEAILRNNNKREPAGVEVRSCECQMKPKTSLSIENKAYQHSLTDLEEPSKTYKNSTVNKRSPLTTGNLIDIARQVAVGMEYLAKNKVVHRDLAARNVLVTEGRIVKIADFGLSRDIYQENIYKKTGAGKLPIKWLALESITHQVYTTQSDVWSYGILLYEIATLGGNPYPSIPTNRLLRVLKAGYRMEKPKHCSHEFYKIMCSCWHVNPGNRPTFTGIIKSLDTLVQDKQHTPHDHIKKSVADASEIYLKPI